MSHPLLDNRCAVYQPHVVNLQQVPLVFKVCMRDNSRPIVVNPENRLRAFNPHGAAWRFLPSLIRLCVLLRISTPTVVFAYKAAEYATAFRLLKFIQIFSGDFEELCGPGDACQMNVV
ncbi:hypothetical protein [Paraburkholderia fungorum]|uniref:hypothetical protein n=1 Tax=Paraburkholderia fungorum TaxID=134537 RepID=UPI0011C37C2F|nr:hypothetical protein [Paraburkholderia fungorum]